MKKFILMLGIVLLAGMNSQAQEMPGLQVGDQAPDFEAVNQSGEIIRLSEYWEGGRVVLVFYRGGWCPYCNRHLQSIQKNIDAILELGAEVIAVSVDTPLKAAETADKQELSFDVLSNPDASILEAYHLIFQVPPDLMHKYKESYDIDLEAYSGRADGVIAVPATYVIDYTGKIIFADANEDYKVRTEPEEIISVLQESE